MIIIDFSQLVLSSIHTQSPETLTSKHALSMMRHLVLNYLRSIKVIITRKSKKKQTVVLACDGQNYWRRQKFPHYKCKRKQGRDSSKYDYTIIFEILDTLIKEFKEFLPYYVIRQYEAEADDIIGTLVQRLHTFDPIYIVSSDKDFRQLQKYSNVYQYDLFKKAWIKEKEPELFLFEQIIRGDTGDGIPNILSPDTTFVESKRQKSITQEFIKSCHSQHISEIAQMEHYERNKTLIDLDCIPEYIQTQIMNEYEHYDMSHGYTKIYDYFVQKRLSNLMHSIEDF